MEKNLINCIRESPEEIIVLAAILLKLAGFGIIRVCPIISSGDSLIQFIKFFSIFGGILISVLCLFQKDLKIMIAYSSVAHMSIIISCVLFKTHTIIVGRILIIIAHGIASSGLFARGNLIYIRAHSRRILTLQGILRIIPTLILLWFFLIMSNMGGPITLNLLRELWLIIRISSVSKILIPLVFILAFFSVAYRLLLYTITSQTQPKFVVATPWPIESYELNSLFIHRIIIPLVIPLSFFL
jgi:NADH-ubiquinone oxidoreductase chain 4